MSAGKETMDGRLTVSVPDAADVLSQHMSGLDLGHGNQQTVQGQAEDGAPSPQSATSLSGRTQPKRLVSNQRGSRMLANIQKTLNHSGATSPLTIRSRHESETSEMSTTSHDTRFSQRIQIRTPLNQSGHSNRNANSNVSSPAQSSHGNRHQTRRAPPPRAEEYKVENLDSLQKILQQFTDMQARSDRSAAQIKRNIMASSYIGTMSVMEWHEVCTHLFGLAIGGGETDFVMDMMPILMQYAAFCDVMCEMLMSVCSSHILYGDTRAIPEFIGSIICGNWPKDLNKAVNSINPVLFITMSIVKGWILVINEDNSLYYTPKSVKRNGANDTDNGQSAQQQQQQEGRNSPVVVEASESRHGSEDIKDDESSISTQAEPSEEDIAALNRCCMALYVLCEKTQRSLWLKWPELCDEIYDAIRPAITHNKHVEPDAKSALLYMYSQMLKWVGPKAVLKSTSTQTCE